jgi:hypothetical protein
MAVTNQAWGWLADVFGWSAATPGAALREVLHGAIADGTLVALDAGRAVIPHCR